MNATVFVDTDILLHYQPVWELDWPEIVEADDVEIIVVPLVVRQLDKHKDTHHRKSIRRRAGARLSSFRDHLRTGDMSVREHVTLRLSAVEPQLEFAVHHLRPDVDDDYLLASIIEFKKAHPDERVLLATGDIGLMLKGHHHGVETVEMPEGARLPGEADPDEARIRELEQKLRELQGSQPDMSLRFLTGESHATFVLEPPIVLSTEERARRLRDVRQRHPRFTPQDGGDPIQQLMRGSVAGGLYQPSSADIYAYNTALNRYYEEYEAHLEQSISDENLGRRTVQLDIALTNSGTAVAEDIDVLLHFPDGFKLFDKSTRPRPAPEPKPPEKPVSALWRLSAGMSGYHIAMPPLDRRAAPPRNVSRPTIRPSNSYTVDVHVGRLKHGRSDPLDPLYVVFESFEAVRSFNIRYRINAANLPSDVENTLHVICKPVSGGADVAEAPG